VRKDSKPSFAAAVVAGVEHGRSRAFRERAAVTYTATGISSSAINRRSGDVAWQVVLRLTGHYLLDVFKKY
jgi:hypothetical protein